jgi:hypothetical protein
MIEKIKEAFNTHKCEEVENVYTPKVQSTVNCGGLSYNETFKHIHEQLKPKPLYELK